MKIQAKFSPLLLDTSSVPFKQLATILEDEVMAILKPKIKYVMAVQVIEFRPGSIIAMFRILLDRYAPEDNVDVNDVTHALRDAIKSGILDSIKVDPLHPIFSEGRNKFLNFFSKLNRVASSNCEPFSQIKQKKYL